MGCRKSLARLTPAERTAFVNAVLALKASGKFDVYNTIHASTMDPAGVPVHGYPLFFPWHRRMILDFEHDLQAIDASVNLPYWDWTVENLNPAATESLIWRDDFMGGPGNAAPSGPVSGPFAAWGFTRRNFDPFQYPGTGGTIATAMTQTNYSAFKSGIEGPHGAAHVWVGGDMADPMTSPHDPAFFLLHANVDRLWAEWIHAHQGMPGFQPYEPAGGTMVGQRLTDPMWPWDGSSRPVAMAPWSTAPVIVRPVDVIDHRALGYFYDTIDPECAPKLKVLDDGTFKFRDDITLKFSDDGTLKFRDDPTLKFIDDIKLKVRDDTLKFGDDKLPPADTLKFCDDTDKFRDDIKTKVADDKQPPTDTLKFVDEKLPAGDTQPGTETIKFFEDTANESVKSLDDTMKAADDPMGKFGGDPRQQPPTGRPMILSTPHHSMAWASTMPTQQGAGIDIKAAIAELEQMLIEMRDAHISGELTPEEMAQFEDLQLQLQRFMDQMRS
jgi:tyrosinase-like protein